MNKKIEEFGWIILALLALIIGFIEILNHSNNEVNWLILTVLCFIVSLQIYKIRKDEENK